MAVAKYFKFDLILIDFSDFLTLPSYIYIIA